MCQPFHSPIEKMASPGDNRVWECASGGVQGHCPGQEACQSKHMFHTFSCGAGAGYRASLSLRDWIRVERWSLVDYSMPENHRTCSLGDYNGFVCYRLTWQTRQNFLNFNMPAGNPGSYQMRILTWRWAPRFCSFNKILCDAGDIQICRPHLKAANMDPSLRQQIVTAPPKCLCTILAKLQRPVLQELTLYLMKMTINE